MTDLISRQPRPPGSSKAAGSSRPRPAAPKVAGRVSRTRHPSAAIRPVPVVGVLVALRSAGLGVLAVMVPVLLAWATAAESGADASDAVATGLQAWLLGHHAHLRVPGGEFALVPLGLTLLPLVLLHVATVRAAKAAGVHGRNGVVTMASSVTATYAVVATLVALVAQTGAVEVVPESAFVGAAGVAALASGTGAIRAAGLWTAVRRWLPDLVSTALPAAGGALAVLVGGGALLAAASLAAHRDRAATLLDGLDTGAGGAVLVLLLCLLYLPTAGVWGLAFAVGPGFTVGAGTSVSVVATELGPVPAFPLLAGLPQPPGPAYGPLALVLPVVAGVLAGLLVRRQAGGSPERDWRWLAETSAVVGGLVAGAVGLLALSASGPAGPGRLAETGPVWWQVAPLAGLEVAAVTAAVLVLLRRREHR